MCARVYISKVAVADTRAFGLDGQFVHLMRAQRFTSLGKRTSLAKRCGRLTLQSSEVHDGLVVKGRVLPVEQLVGKGTKEFLALHGIDRLCYAEVASQNPLHIAVEHSMRFAESQTHDGCCGVVANAWQSPHKAVILGEAASLGNLLSCLVEVPSPAVVTQSLP